MTTTTETTPALPAPGPFDRRARPVYQVTARGVLAGEWTKFWSLRSTWITLGGSALLLVAIGAIASASFAPHGHAPGGGADGGTSDAISLALGGSTFAALIVGVLGVLLSAGEYTTGMVRSTFAAVPRRLPVLWAKSLIAGVTVFGLMCAAAVTSLAVSSPLLRDDVTALGLGDDGVAQCLLGAGLYLGLVAVFGVALGALVRYSAGGIALLAGILLVLPGLVMLLPDSWNEEITPYLPSNAGTVVMSLTPSGDSLAPWTGLAVFAGYVALTLGAAAVRLVRTDA